MRQKSLLRLISAISVSAIITGCLQAAAAQTDGGASIVGGGGSEYNQTSYLQTQKEYSEKGYVRYSGEAVEIPLSSAQTDAGAPVFETGIGGENGDVLCWNDEIQWIEFTMTVPEDGLYCMRAEYFVMEGYSSYAERGLTIDGEPPFKEASNIRFTRYYKDAVDKPLINSLGDEVPPRQEEIQGWYTTNFTDNQGVSSYPFEFYLTKGEHKLRLSYVNEGLALRKLTLQKPERPDTYAEKKAEYEAKGYQSANKEIKFQAEDTASAKSSPTLRRVNNGDPILEPTAYDHVVLNVMGEYNWRNGNDSITWDFHVEETGLYKLSFRVLQSWGDGMPSHRQILIDGDIPFAEMAQFAFYYDRSWRKQTLSDDNGDPYLFYLEEGDHSITMSVKVGPTAEILEVLNSCSTRLSALVRKVIMITGNTPDVNYDYELEKNIPELIPSLSGICDDLRRSINALTAMSVKTPASANNLKVVLQQLEKLIQKPRNIPKSFTDLNNSLSSIGNVVLGMQQQPLAIDYFHFTPVDQEIVYDKSSFFEKLWATLVNFGLSFVKDYNAIGSVQYGEVEIIDTIEVWITRGKEYGELIKTMADEQFTPETGISVNVNILPAAAANAGGINPLMLAINSGRAPDVCMGQPSSQPAEYAFREVVADLTQFPDFEEVSSRFLQEVLVPMTVDGGVYALPDTMNFRVLFYRKDIMQELGLTIPDTWEELYQYVMPVLNQSGMQFYNAAVYDVFLYQHNGKFFTDDGSASALDSKEAYAAFKELCELYTSYGVPVTADFFNRFRTGEMPMGIGDYSVYTKISAAAPELNGLWSIAPIPGRKQEDGSINRSVGPAAIDSTILLADSEKQKEGWAFMEWWSRSDVQTTFARDIEARIGVEARWTSANVEAFKALPWKVEERPVIVDELQWVRESPIYLGSYFSGRHVGNAYNRVVISDIGIRDSLEQAVEDINTELRRKQEQFGVYKGQK